MPLTCENVIFFPDVFFLDTTSTMDNEVYITPCHSTEMIAVYRRYQSLRNFIIIYYGRPTGGLIYPREMAQLLRDAADV